MSDNRIKVALFGGSFNPPHVGHVQIVAYLLGELAFDQVWVIPCFRHPFGKKLVPFWDRLKMARLALQAYGSRVRVLDLERRLKGVSWTWRTIRYLKRRHPDADLSWVIGGDQEKEKWRHFDRISKAVTLVEIPRGSKSPIRDVSSSEVREALVRGNGADELIPACVLGYLRRLQLYSV